MSVAWSEVSTYQVRMHYTQIQGRKSESRTVDFSYMLPGWVRIDIIKGKDKGTTVVYDPVSHRVRAQRFPLPAPVSFSPDATVVRTLRGERIYEASLAAMLDRASRYQSQGSLTLVESVEYKDKQCSVIEFNLQPSSIEGIARERWWLDTQTGFPVRVESFDNQDTRVIILELSGLLLNPDFSPEHFSF